MMEEMLHQISSLTKRMDVIWTHLFDKPESSGEKTKEGEEQEVEVHKEKPDGEDHTSGMNAPPFHNLPFQGSKFTHRSHTMGGWTNHRSDAPFFMERGDSMDY
jgi:hypothetical protein